MPEEPGQGTHRYAFLVYQQPGYQSIEPPAKRANFQVGRGPLAQLPASSRTAPAVAACAIATNPWYEQGTC